MIRMNTLRQVPSRCELRGEVGVFGRPIQCQLVPKRAISVEGLSPLYVCNSHGKAMEKFWGNVYEVVNKPI